MSFEGYRRDLQDVLRHRALVAWADARGEAPPVLPGELVERRQDLVSGEGLAALDTATSGCEPGGTAAWLRSVVAREAVELHCGAERLDVHATLDALRWPDRRATRWAEMTWRLATLPRDRDRRSFLGPFESGCSAAGRLMGDLAAAYRRSLPVRLAEPFPPDHARDRPRSSLQEACRDLLAATDEPFAAEIGPARRLAGCRDAGRGEAIDLPWFRSGAGLATSMPSVDVSLIAYLARPLGIGDALVGRLRTEITERSAPWPAPGVRVLVPGSEVRLVGSRRGAPEDYRALLGGFGAAAAAALQEEPVDLDGWLVDPALGLLYTALFEHLSIDPGWVERATGRPPEEGWRRLGRIHLWLRTRELAATVLAGDASPALFLPVAGNAEQLGRATGFEHPDGLVPWAPEGLSAADEFVARLAAPLLADRLASRWGNAWYATSGAGRLLRDLWAAPHPTLGGLLADLGLGEPSVEPFLAGSPRGV